MWQPMPAVGAASLGHFGRGVVRAARAEIGRAVYGGREVGQPNLTRLEIVELVADRFALKVARKAFSDHMCDLPHC